MRTEKYEGKTGSPKATATKKRASLRSIYQQRHEIIKNEQVLALFLFRLFVSMNCLVHVVPLWSPFEQY